MLIFLPVMLFPNAPNNVRLCFRNIPVMLWTYSIILHFFTTHHCLRELGTSACQEVKLQSSNYLNDLVRLCYQQLVVVHVVLAGTLASLVAISSGITNKRHMAAFQPRSERGACSHFYWKYLPATAGSVTFLLLLLLIAKPDQVVSTFLI